MDSKPQQISQPMQPQQSKEESECGTNEFERQKLNYLEKIAQQQEKTNEFHLHLLSSLEKTNNKLHLIVENQRLERRNHDRMIELLYRIAYNK